MEPLINKMDHIGLAVKSIDEARHLYEDVLGLTVQDILELPQRKVRVGMIRTENQILELVEPLGEDSPIHTYLEKRGEGIHHIAFEVSDIEAALQRLKIQDVELITPEPYEGAHGKKVAFLSPRSCHGVLIELCQKKD